MYKLDTNGMTQVDTVDLGLHKEQFLDSEHGSLNNKLEIILLRAEDTTTRSCLATSRKRGII